MEQEQVKNPYAPVIGEAVEKPSATVVLGGYSVTVYPMTVTSLEALTKELSEPLNVVLRELLTSPDTAGAISAGNYDAAFGVIQELFQKHIAGALAAAPGLLRRVAAIVINFPSDHPLLANASLRELTDVWSVLAELNDISLIWERLSGLVGGLAKRLPSTEQVSTLLEQAQTEPDVD